MNVPTTSHDVGAPQPRVVMNPDRVDPQARRILDIEAVGMHVARYGLALILVWVGAMKFTGYEAAGILPLIQHSPFLAWLLGFLTIGQVSAALGVYEIAAGVLIALRPVSPRLSAVGSALTVPMFLVTLTFLFSTPGWEPSLGGFPALSAMVGQFVIKDVVLLGAGLLTLAEALKATLVHRPRLDS